MRFHLCGRSTKSLFRAKQLIDSNLSIVQTHHNITAVGYFTKQVQQNEYNSRTSTHFYAKPYDNQSNLNRPKSSSIGNAALHIGLSYTIYAHRGTRIVIAVENETHFSSNLHLRLELVYGKRC